MFKGRRLNICRGSSNLLCVTTANVFCPFHSPFKSDVCCTPWVLQLNMIRNFQVMSRTSSAPEPPWDTPALPSLLETWSQSRWQPLLGAMLVEMCCSESPSSAWGKL